MNHPDQPMTADHRRVDSEDEAQAAEPGEIRVAPSGNVVIGLPTVVATGEAPPPSGGS